MRVRLIDPQAAGRVALIDSKDWRLVSGYAWQVLESKRKGRKPTAYAYARIRRDGREATVYMHQLIGGWPMTDHVNHDGLDNRRRNLRPATPAQNAQNRRPHLGTSSRYKGVSRRGGKWSAAINVGDGRRYLGRFADEKDAARAYNAAALEAYGAYAYLNPVDGEPGVPAA